MVRRKAVVPRALAPRDGTNILCTSYFEVSYCQEGVATAGKLSYSLKIAPQGLVLKLSEAPKANNATLGLFANKGDNAALMTAPDLSGNVPLTRFGEFAGIYKQYKINSCKISVIVDRDQGLENPICFTSSKNNDIVHADIGAVVGGPHKQYTMTESRRTANYGWAAKTTEDKHYHMSGDALDKEDAHFIKVFQEIDPKANSLAKHRVSVSLNITMKDSSKN
jgi:hypothetical protein